jgi:hypothetical protein
MQIDALPTPNYDPGSIAYGSADPIGLQQFVFTWARTLVLLQSVFTVYSNTHYLNQSDGLNIDGNNDDNPSSELFANRVIGHFLFQGTRTPLAEYFYRISADYNLLKRTGNKVRLTILLLPQQ